MPSPILPDGTMISFPILSKGPGSIQLAAAKLHRTYDHVRLAHELSSGRISQTSPIHMDPDLNEHTFARMNGWRPAFGQVAAAQGHLRNQNVGVDDIFIFFGWFKQAHLCRGSWAYVPDAPDIHVIFGWLQIGSIIAAGDDPSKLIAQSYPWLKNHPHAQPGYGPTNTIYIADDKLKIPGCTTHLPGGGTIPSFTPRCQLTKSSSPGLNVNRSTWELPDFFCREGRINLSYHYDRQYERHSDHVTFQSASRGQEFVYTCNNEGDPIFEWVNSILSSAGL
ncbi:hypothetical protein ACSSZE_18665 [Acidithiobacillus caldus]